jgi:hypothetical protein
LFDAIDWSISTSIISLDFNNSREFLPPRLG